MPPLQLEKRISRQASVEEIPDGWRFHLGPGDGKQYHLAQLDDYAHLPRNRFAHISPITLELSARASQEISPGTWGFGFWNDPGPMFTLKPVFLRFPALPNAAWFFFAAPSNHLSLRNSQIGGGNFAGVYSSPRVPSVLLSPFIIMGPLLLFKATSRLLRALASRIVRHELISIETNPNQWHRYKLIWGPTRSIFEIDGQIIFQSNLVPKPPLALVLWSDNQYGAWRPDGSLGYGVLPVPADCWVEIKGLRLIEE